MEQCPLCWDSCLSPLICEMPIPDKHASFLWDNVSPISLNFAPLDSFSHGKYVEL